MSNYLFANNEIWYEENFASPAYSLDKKSTTVWTCLQKIYIQGLKDLVSSHDPANEIKFEFVTEDKHTTTYKLDKWKYEWKTKEEQEREFGFRLGKSTMEKPLSQRLNTTQVASSSNGVLSEMVKSLENSRRLKQHFQPLDGQKGAAVSGALSLE